MCCQKSVFCYQIKKLQQSAKNSEIAHCAWRHQWWKKGLCDRNTSKFQSSLFIMISVFNLSIIGRGFWEIVPLKSYKLLLEFHIWNNRSLYNVKSSDGPMIKGSPKICILYTFISNRAHCVTMVTHWPFERRQAAYPSSPLHTRYKATDTHNMAIAYRLRVGWSQNRNFGLLGKILCIILILCFFKFSFTSIDEYGMPY